MIVNHMCMDGGDFKYFMKKLAENYNKLLDGERDLDIKTAAAATTRSTPNSLPKRRKWREGFTRTSVRSRTSIISR